MAARNPPIFLQAGSHPAEHVRRWIHAMSGGSEGVINSGDFLVTQNGTPNMTVNIAAGRAFILGDSASLQGTYFVENDATINTAVAAADGTNPRIDRVIAEVRDAAYAGADNDWRVRIITGTPAGSPVAPALPINAISLATLSVPALDTTIGTAQITDTRPRSFLMGGTVVCTSTTRPAVPYEGMRAFETDTNRDILYDGTSWHQLNEFAAVVATSQTTTSASYVDLATVGPSVSILTGTKALVNLSCYMDNSGGNFSFYNFAVSGATTIAAASIGPITKFNTGAEQLAGMVIVTGLNPGVNTFTTKYAVSAGTGTFSSRNISVVSLLA